MMNYIFGAMLAVSFVCAAINGKTEELTNAVIESGYTAVTVFISLYGVMILWNGLMRVAEKAGVTNFIGRMTYPFLRFLFPTLKKGGAEILRQYA